MDNAIIKTYLKTTTRKGHSTTVQYRVATSAGCLTRADLRSRWIKTIGRDSIIGVKTVAVQSDFLFPGDAPKTDAEWAEHAKYSLTTYTVIETLHGTAAVQTFSGGSSEIVGFIGHRHGKKDKALTVGTWRKYGSKRGHGLAWQRAMQAAGTSTTPDSGKDVCLAEVYERLSAGIWPNQAARDHGHPVIAL